MRHQLATIHELARLDVFQGLSGEALGRIAERTWRVDLEPGKTLAADPDVRLHVVLSGLLTAASGVLGQGALIRDPGAAPVRAIGSARLLACDEATYEELVAPLLPEA